MSDTINENVIRPCVGCGYCCITARCSASVRIWPSSNIEDCPALIWNGTRYVCDLMLKNGKMGFDYRQELYEGAGCCSGLNSWRSDVKVRRDKDLGTLIKYKLDKPFAAFVRSLAGCFMGSDAMFLSIRGMRYQLEKSGYSDAEISAIELEIQYHYTNFKSSFMEEFVG